MTYMKKSLQMTDKILSDNVWSTALLYSRISLGDLKNPDLWKCMSLQTAFLTLGFKLSSIVYSNLIGESHQIYLSSFHSK